MAPLPTAAAVPQRRSVGATAKQSLPANAIAVPAQSVGAVVSPSPDDVTVPAKQRSAASVKGADPAGSVNAPSGPASVPITFGTQGAQGPAGATGATGAQGAPGTVGGRTIEIEVEAIGGAQTIVIPAPFGAVQSMFINGLRQRPSSFTVIGNVVTTPSDIVAGDFVSILYFPA